MGMGWGTGTGRALTGARVTVSAPNFLNLLTLLNLPKFPQVMLG